MPAVSSSIIFTEVPPCASGELAVELHDRALGHGPRAAHIALKDASGTREQVPRDGRHLGGGATGLGKHGDGRSPLIALPPFSFSFCTFHLELFEVT